jgi:hypothetical protein
VKEILPTACPPTAHSSFQFPIWAAVIFPERVKRPKPSVAPMGVVTTLVEVPLGGPVTVTAVDGFAPVIETVQESPGTRFVDPEDVENVNCGLEATSEGGEGATGTKPDVVWYPEAIEACPDGAV